MKLYYPSGSNREISNNTEKTKKPNWYRQAERYLKQYKYMEAELDNMKLQLRFNRLSGTSITAQLRQVVVQSSNISSPSESYVIKKELLEERIERKEIQLAMLENVIKSFNAEESLAYKLRYELEKGEKEVWMRLQMSRSSYFELQKIVVLKTALLMQITVPDDDIPEEWRGGLFA